MYREKGEKPLLPLPPQGGLTGWRDPFLVGRPGDGLHDKYTIIIGSGYMDEERKEPSRGAVFVYTSDNPTSGWKYEGELCHGDGSTGAVWECPLLARVDNHPDYKGNAEPNEHILVVCPDNPHNTPVYFLGRYDPKTLKFDMENASGPHPVDLGGGPLGSTFYAPNVLNNDPHGRLIMWGWCQETGRPGDPEVYDYGSCLSVPRLIWRHPHKPGVIWQEPLPCLSQLRREAWHLSGGDSPYWTKITTENGGNNDAVGSNGHSTESRANGALANGNGLESANGNGNGASANVPGSITPDSRVNLKTGHPVALPTELGSHPHLELELTLEPPTTLPTGVSAKTGIIIRSNEIVPMTLHEASGRNGAALLYDWRHARLEVVFSDGMEDLETLCSAPAVTYDIMNSTSRVYLTSHDAQAGESAQPDSVLNMSTIKEGQEAEAPQCHIIHDEDTAAQGSAAPLHSAHGMSGRSGSAASDHDAEHRPLDVRGCHAVGGQLELWPGMDANTNGAPSSTDNSELAQASRSGMAASRAAVDGVLQPIKLRVFLDHSMLEALTSTGQVGACKSCVLQWFVCSSPCSCAHSWTTPCRRCSHQLGR
uniref:Glycosyl hydrolase family 32 N-terminal domain-containing protein n=1 Tax=Dunaliella tertiolecta TaxID=3047 RepID=A0A7S3QTD5_DUNTE